MQTAETFEFLAPTNKDTPSPFLNAVSDLLEQIRVGIDRCEKQEPIQTETLPNAVQQSVIDRLL